jgi:hypothetical protein
MEPIEQCARAAAQRLTSEFGPRGDRRRRSGATYEGAFPRPERYFDPVSLGGLTVSIATLAWTIYKDIRKTAPRPSHEVLARRIRVQLSDADELDPAKRDRIIDVVVEEALQTPTADHEDPVREPDSPSSPDDTTGRETAR